LDARHAGAYAVFIYDPSIDKPVADYLNGTALAQDTGVGVMALFERKPRAVASGIAVPGVGPIGAASPLVDFVRALLPGQHLELPGLLLVARLSKAGHPVYVSLAGLVDSKAVASRSRSALAISSKTLLNPGEPGSNADQLGRGLALAGIPYVKGDERSVTEFLFIALRALWDARKDIVALVPTVAKVAGKLTGGSGE
jgi:hypothetical protein